ncbi:MAG: tail fiber domain-containing protein [Bacteroidales bacterium]
MKNTIILSAAIIFTICFTSNAQIRVASNNNVGVGVDNPVSKFAIGGVGNSYSKAYIFNSNITASSRGLEVYQAKVSSSWGYGLVTSVEQGSNSGIIVGLYSSAYRGSTPTITGHSYGVLAYAGNATSGWNHAVSGQLLGSNNGAAIYGIVPGKSGFALTDIWAGYFRGKVYAEEGLWTSSVNYISDINLKKDIKLLDKGNIEKLKSLQAIKFKIKSPFELENFNSKPGMDTISQASIQRELNDPIYNQEHIGLSAQDIQLVYPELVKTDNEGTLAVDYISMIPILVEAIKEQQAKIDELQAQVAKLAGTKPK